MLVLYSPHLLVHYILTLFTWFYFLSEWLSLWVCEGVYGEKLVRVTVVWGPVEQVHLTATATSIYHNSIVMSREVLSVCVYVYKCV